MYFLHFIVLLMPFYSLDKSELPLVELLTFASEGDNTVDAIRMVAFVDEWLKIVPKDGAAAGGAGRPALKFPISWNHMFGNQPPTQIY